MHLEEEVFARVISYSLQAISGDSAYGAYPIIIMLTAFLPLFLSPSKECLIHLSLKHYIRLTGLDHRGGE